MMQRVDWCRGKKPRPSARAQFSQRDTTVFMTAPSKYFLLPWQPRPLTTLSLGHITRRFKSLQESSLQQLFLKIFSNVLHFVHCHDSLVWSRKIWLQGGRGYHWVAKGKKIRLQTGNYCHNSRHSPGFVSSTRTYTVTVIHQHKHTSTQTQCHHFEEIKMTLRENKSAWRHRLHINIAAVVERLPSGN